MANLRRQDIHCQICRNKIAGADAWLPSNITDNPNNRHNLAPSGFKTMQHRTTCYLCSDECIKKWNLIQAANKAIEIDKSKFIHDSRRKFRCFL